jgi:RNA polymerase sigma factor (sigma-70 family)
MDTTSEVIQELTFNWASIHAEVALLVPTIEPSEGALMEILEANQQLVESWARKATTDDFGNAPERVRSAIIELLLWSLFRQCRIEAGKRQLLGALWRQCEQITKGCAVAIVRNLPSQSRRDDAVEQYMQEGFFQFEEALNRYDPSKRQTMLRTFVRTFYRSRMINIAKSKVMKTRDAEHLTDADHPVDRSETEARLAQEQKEEIEQALREIASHDERDAEQVVAFRKFMIDGMNNAEIASELGRTTSWVTKAHQRVRGLLREMLLK